MAETRRNRADLLHDVLRDRKPRSRGEIFQATGEFFLTNNAASELRARLEPLGLTVAHWQHEGEHIYAVVPLDGGDSPGRPGHTPGSEAGGSPPSSEAGNAPPGRSVTPASLQSCGRLSPLPAPAAAPAASLGSAAGAAQRSLFHDLNVRDGDAA